jgi:hypothetical protein
VPHRAIEYDVVRRRVWLFGQRCHHGATGALLTCVGLAAASRSVRHALTLAAAGSLLMAHDWKDRTRWFERGYGSQR